ncbi:nucleotide exchange factor SIL1-like isoform X1 [Macrobrachium nipponense]|uniref:nucleotide exchange factor SIL1-like isoform X1 n=2 Tax=Macrobrachium nipponense TaxID=159736 RepID=UPI0030C7A480
MKSSASCILFVMLASLILLVKAQNPENHQLVLVESDEADDEVEVEEEFSREEKPFDISKVFIPTNEWQIVKPDQTVLPGLHIRMNLQTGLKEAKLMDGDDGTNYFKALENLRNAGDTGIGQAVIPSPSEEQENLSSGSPESAEREEMLRKNIIEALKNIKSDDGKTPEELSLEAAESRKKFRSYEDLKKDFDEINISMETDNEILTRVINQYQKSDSDDQKVILLEDLEYLVHQFDNGITFVDLGGIEIIVKPALNSTSSIIKQGALHLLGSAVQGNPKVQIAALEAGLLQLLIRAVTQDPKDGVSRKAIYALSCLVRGFPYGQQALVQHGGLEVLRKIFDRKDWQSLPLQLKVVSLVHDLLMERAEAEGERLQQLNRLDITEQLAIGGWCPAVSSLLTAASFDRRDRRYDMGAALRNELPLRPDHDTVDKVVSAMDSMVEVCRYHFNEALPLLRHLANTYDDLAYKEQFQDDEGGYGLFRGLAEMIQKLIKNINVKEEL